MVGGARAVRSGVKPAFSIPKPRKVASATKTSSENTVTGFEDNSHRVTLENTAAGLKENSYRVKGKEVPSGGGCARRSRWRRACFRA